MAPIVFLFVTVSINSPSDSASSCASMVIGTISVPKESKVMLVAVYRLKQPGQRRSGRRQRFRGASSRFRLMTIPEVPVHRYS